MRAVVQRVREARVDVEGATVHGIGRGLLVLLCAMAGDEAADETWLLDKLLALRVFADDAGKMNLALHDIHRPEAPAGLLLVSQFTLSAEIGPGKSKGNRPAFLGAMAPDPARAAFDRVVAAARSKAPWLDVGCGVFGADMQVHLVNDGPVTLWLDTRLSGAAESAS